MPQNEIPQAPPTHVLRAFGLTGAPTLLSGGRGNTWRVDDAVLKPFHGDVQELEFQTHLLKTPLQSVRVVAPRLTNSGGYTTAGWAAWPYLSGDYRRGQWLEIIAAGERFHQALQEVPEPEFMRRRTDPWARADRAAWSQPLLTPYLDDESVRRLSTLLAPVLVENQVVHCDLTGNVLFERGAPPAIIDLSLYFRPRAYATAIVVADALAWESASAELADWAAMSNPTVFGQCLVRALLFRIVTDLILADADTLESTRSEAYNTAIEVAFRLIKQRL
jgi:uncharacterized protein (TIGR02569 family)